MVKLNPRLILLGISSVNFDKRDLAEAEQQFHRVTHLHLQNKKITKLTNLNQFENLTVLYLYENQITQIKGLYGSTNLESLYLQKNYLDRVNGLTECTKLQKLFLGYNAIQCLDGLDALVELQELHVEYQRLKPTDHLMIDPMSLSTLSTCLRVLDISGNHISTLEDLAGMQIQTLIARDNRLENLDNTILIISTLDNLQSLDLRENSITKIKKYREKIIGYSSRLELLDNKEVTDCSRRFMQSFCRMKAARLKRIVDSYNELPESMTGSMTTTGENLAFFSPEKRNSFVETVDENITMPMGVSSHTYKNQTFHQEPNGTEPNDNNSNTKLQLKSQSLEFLVSPKLLKPQEMSVPKFVLAPPTFLNGPKPKKTLTNKNINKNSSQEFSNNQLKMKSLFVRESTSVPVSSRMDSIFEENEVTKSIVSPAESELEPKRLRRPASMSKSISSSVSTTELKTDVEYVPQELRAAEAHYSEMIESDFPVPEFAKLMLGLHSRQQSSNAADAGGDDAFGQQGKSIKWTVMSPASGSITDLQSSKVRHPPESFELLGYPDPRNPEPLSLRGIKASRSRPSISQMKQSTEFSEWQQWMNYNMSEGQMQQLLSASAPSGECQLASSSEQPRYIPVVPRNPYQQLPPPRTASTGSSSRKPSLKLAEEWAHLNPKGLTKPTPKKKKGKSNLPSKQNADGIEMIPIPVFQKQVYELPPWPHIIKMGSREPRITYMP